MYPVYPARSTTVHPPPQAGLHRDVLEAVQAKLALLDPALDPRSPRGRVAVMVMAAAIVGRNVDRLARVTRMDREVAARFCRRLFDADVDPAEMGTGHHDFWNVVGLAEGRLARRVDDMGRVHWVPVGAGTRGVEHDWPTGAAPARRPGGATPVDDEPWARARGRSEARTGRDVPAIAASAVELFPGAEWLT